jgi:hypothetical protein
VVIDGVTVEENWAKPATRVLMLAPSGVTETNERAAEVPTALVAVTEKV